MGYKSFKCLLFESYWDNSLCLLLHTVYLSCFKQTFLYSNYLGCFLKQITVKYFLNTHNYLNETHSRHNRFLFTNSIHKALVCLLS